jgi:hypothetical protein
MRALLGAAVIVVGCGVDHGAPADASNDSAAARACELAMSLSADACASIEVTAASAVGCTTWSEPGFEHLSEDLTGTWVRLHRAADEGATVEVTVLSLPSECQVDGTDCPEAYVRGAGTEPCSCGLTVQAYQLAAIDEVWSRVMVATDEEILLSPQGARFRVTLCASSADPFPTCDPEETWAGGGEPCPPGIGYVGSDGTKCVCQPACDSDLDCPQPRAIARASCISGGCVIVCTNSSECRAGEECLDVLGQLRCVQVR